MIVPPPSPQITTHSMFEVKNKVDLHFSVNILIFLILSYVSESQKMMEYVSAALESALQGI